MNTEATIVSLLSNIGVSAYPLVAPHDAITPCVVYQKIFINPLRTHEGYVADRSRWQLACWAYTYDESVALAEQVRAAFDLNQIEFELSTREGEIDLPDPDTNLYRRILDFQIWK